MMKIPDNERNPLLSMLAVIKHKCPLYAVRSTVSVPFTVLRNNPLDILPAKSLFSCFIRFGIIEAKTDGVDMNEFRDAIIQRVCTFLNGEQLERLENVLDIVMYNFNISVKKSEIIVYDNSNEATLKKFIATKRLEGLKKDSLEQYYRSVNNMFKEFNKPLNEINTDDIRYYLSMYQEKRKVTKATLNNTRRYLSTFFTWCTDEDIISKNPMRRIKAIKQQKIIKEPFSEMEMEQIRNSADSIRNRALIEFLYSTGCRVSEVSRVNIDDIDFEHKSLMVIGKGDKQREVYITDKAMYWMKKYLSLRNDTGTSLFVGRKNNALQKAGIEAVVRKIGKKAGVKKVHPHRFRRTMATNLINKGMAIQEVQQILGHEKIDTTMIYCKVDKSNVQNSHKRYAA